MKFSCGRNSSLASPAKYAFHSTPWLAAMFGVILITGCGDDGEFSRLNVYPVEGKVTFKGSPADGAIVTLHPTQDSLSALRPSGKIGTDGSFKITTYEQGDGAPVGSYKVTVQLFKLPANADDVRPGRSVLPAKYASPKTSGLTVEVTEAVNGANVVPPIEIN